MKKKFILLCTTLASLSCNWAKADTYYVSTAPEFLEALNDNHASIILKGDLDFTGVNISDYNPVAIHFYGAIDGKGYSLKNLSYKNNTGREENHYGLVNYAKEATFQNIVIEGWNINAEINTGALVGRSTSCTYKNIVLKDSKIIVNQSHVGGIVSHSNQDRFYDCSTSGNTNLSTKIFSYAGGIASVAKGSSFINCENNATVDLAWDYGGGIVASCENCTFTRCVNHGFLYQEKSLLIPSDYLGGIVGEAKSSDFEYCVNTGKLTVDNSCGGGIVGIGEKVNISNCLNSSKDLHFPDTPSGGIIGKATESKVVNCLSVADYPLIGKAVDMKSASGNNYRLQGKNNETSNWEMGVSEEQLTSGRVAYWLNSWDETQVKPWRQNLVSTIHTADDADACPVLDDSHDVVSYLSLLPTVITSTNELQAFAKRVNDGDMFAMGILGDDLDLTGIDWTPIGTDKHAFRGIFDGNGHTIKGLKLSINGGNMGAGFFGVVKGHAEIRNLLVDATSEISNTNDAGTAAIVGQFNTGWHWSHAIIENCGTAAKVSGSKHVGGILGRVITGDKTANCKVYIKNCYNVGSLSSSNGMSGLLCGYTKNNAYITNCYFAGDLKTGNIFDSSNPSKELEYFAGYEQKIFVSNCYAKYAVPDNQRQLGVSIIDEDELLTSGELTYLLNGRDSRKEYIKWYQVIGQDTHPMLFCNDDRNATVYTYLEDSRWGYTNSADVKALTHYGPISIQEGTNFNLAYLDGYSTKDLTLTQEITVNNAILERSFSANVPSTLVLPFSANTDLINCKNKFFTFDAMNYDEETGNYTAIMKETEGGQLAAYTPYLVLMSKAVDKLEFGNVTIKPATPAVTQQDEWYFIGSNDYKVISLDEEESQYYYGYAGLAFDGFKLGEFVRLGEGAAIAPFRCYMRHAASTGAPDSFDVITKAPTRAAGPDNLIGVVTEGIPMPEYFEVILKAANGETGIATFDNETGEFTFQGWYDLNGNRVEEGYQGVRVGAGKKIIIK